MTQVLSKNVQEDLLSRGFSRRHLGRVLGLMSAGSAIPFFNEAALAQAASGVYSVIPSDVVRINGNENPLPPCNEAVEAVARVTKYLNRYQPTNELDQFREAAAESEGLKPENIIAFAGSSDPLH